MNDRERFLAHILGEKLDRPCYYIFFPPWGTTAKRWVSEGPFKNRDTVDNPNFLFDDIWPIFKPDIPPKIIPVNCGPYPKFPDKDVIEEDENFIVHLDSWGIKRRDYKNHESMSEFLEFPVKDVNSWREFMNERLDPDRPERLEGDWEKTGRDWIV